MKLSIVIPCYNESGNIPLIISRFQEVLGTRQDVEVLLVNNGSKDNSQEVFERELKRVQDNRLRLVKVEVNQGYGFGILSGLKEATGDILAWTHADMQTDPKDVLTGFDLLQQQPNPFRVFVKGKRKNRRWIEAFFTWGMQVLSSIVLKTSLDDINAQPKIFSRDFYNKFLTQEAPYDFSLDLYVLYQAKKNGYTILEIPVFFNKRIYGEAKGGGSFKTRIKLIKRTWKYIFELAKKLKKTDS
ncbi:MAG: glycosyltransferase family 2 protein [Cytophagales bacterium]|nr:glycosyltransferase family 2 protein [Cytophagales bacterium]MDW8385307.1 glycosyltransferase family 2 protein [Flammeovirgaceae bacterium]